MGRRGASLGGACACATFALLAGPAQAAVTTVEPSYRVAVERNVVVPMTDGTRLVADVYLTLLKPAVNTVHAGSFLLLPVAAR